MRTAVIGAGIVGVTTAYELAAAGHEVDVFDAKSSVAEGASFANAGVVSSVYAGPWAAPGLRGRLLGSLLRGDGLTRIGWGAAVRHAPWLWRWFRAAGSPQYSARRAAMWRLSQFSRQRLLHLSATLDLNYEQEPGYLVLLRTERELKAMRKQLALWADLGAAFELVDAAKAHQLEPGLHTETTLRAAIHLPQDGIGNCRHFAQLLKAEAQRLGVNFHFERSVSALRPGPRPALQFGANEVREYDAVAVCAGLDAPRLLSPLKLQLALVPVHGHAVTAPLRLIDGLPTPGPRAGVLDERHAISITRLGQRLRVAGLAQLGGPPPRPDDRALATLYRVLDDWFPGAAQTWEAQHWSGARASLPEGPPVVGPSGLPGVWLNLGHGSSGWTLACGSALALARQMGGEDPGLDMSGLSAARLR